LLAQDGVAEAARRVGGGVGVGPSIPVEKCNRQRFSGRISDDGNTITASWEKSTGGANWEHDFDMAYRRIDR